MPKKILLIENDSAFAGTLSESLEAAGFDVRVAAEGKSGLDLAREWGPEGIVLCVELPGMSGYLVCQKLRKDDATRTIPLVLASAEATEDTFEKHKALKVRADAYLLKPFVPAALLDKLAEVGLPAEPEEPPAITDELSLDPVGADSGGIELDPSTSVDDLPSLELDSLPDEPAPEPAPGPAAEAAPAPMDDDLAFLDEAFEGIANPPAARPAAEHPVGDDELSAAAASLPEEDESAGRAALGALELGEEDPLAGLADDEPAPTPAPVAPPVRAPSADVLRAAGIPLLDDAPPRPSAGAPRTTLSGVSSVNTLRMPVAAPQAPAPAALRGDGAGAERVQKELAEARATVAARQAEIETLRSRADEAAQRAESAESTGAEREAELASVRARLDAIAGQARRSEQDLKAAREEARRATTELEALRARLADAERRVKERAEAADRLEALERELESTRTELIVARGEAEGVRGEVDARATDLNKRIAELEAQSAKNEERVFKAYQKIKGDEKVKDKVRKAIAIAAQLLEEGLPAEPAAPAEKSSKVS
jgi:CheY-like chemotaxis protein